ESQQHRFFLHLAIPLLGPEGVREWIGACMDVHERREDELALREADRRKDEFLATLAHELRNPLAPLSNSIALIERAGDDAALVADAIATTKRQMAHLVRLVDDLLDVSRVTRDNLELRKERVALAGLVEHVVEECSSIVEAAGHKHYVSIPA